jgi:hypothetical protein
VGGCGRFLHFDSFWNRNDGFDRELWGAVVSCGRFPRMSLVYFGFCAGFLGMSEGDLMQKRAVNDGKMCG